MDEFELDNRDIDTTEIVVGQTRVTLETKRFLESVYQVDIDNMKRIHEVIIQELLTTAFGYDERMLMSMLDEVTK